jgi:hypothetical protein
MRSVDLVVAFHCCEKRRRKEKNKHFVVHSIKAKRKKKIIAQ